MDQAANQANAANHANGDNPLLDFTDLPRFSEIRPEHIVFDSPARLVSPSSSGEQPAIPMQEMPAMTIPQGSGAGRRKLSNIVQISEARAIMETLEACGGNRVVAASQLGISERTLRYRLASFREAGLAVAGAGR